MVHVDFHVVGVIMGLVKKMLSTEIENLDLLALSINQENNNPEQHESQYPSKQRLIIRRCLHLHAMPEIEETCYKLKVVL